MNAPTRPSAGQAILSDTLELKSQMDSRQSIASSQGNSRLLARIGMVLAAGVTISMMAAAESVAPTKSILDGVYSAAQIDRGRKAYDSLCARCHGEALGGGEDSPALVDEDFLKNWYGKSLGDLIEYTREEMPSDGPGKVTRKESTDITAFVLSANDFPAGPRDLEPTLDVLNKISITPKK